MSITPSPEFKIEQKSKKQTAENIADFNLYSYVVGKIKAIGYVVNMTFTPEQINLIKKSGNETDGKTYIWNRSLLQDLLKRNSHIYRGSVDSFVKRIMDQYEEDNINWGSPIACLIHAAFADPSMFSTANCFSLPIELPPKLHALLEIGSNYNLQPEDIWWVTAETPVSSWPQLLKIYEFIQEQHTNEIRKCWDLKKRQE